VARLAEMKRKGFIMANPDFSDSDGAKPLSLGTSARNWRCFLVDLCPACIAVMVCECGGFTHSALTSTRISWLDYRFDPCILSRISESLQLHHAFCSICHSESAYYSMSLAKSIHLGLGQVNL
jgi:hypothetical protein